MRRLQRVAEQKLAKRYEERPTALDVAHSLRTLVALKLASGMSNPGRLKDLGDVQAAIGAVGLPRAFGDELHPWVRAKWFELWNAWDKDPRRGEY